MIKNTVAGKSIEHDSAKKHVSGRALYIDDIKTPDNCLHIAFALSTIARGQIKSINITQAKKAIGVRGVLLAKDIKNLYIGAIVHDEPLLAINEVLFYGQALCVVLADSYENARKAASLVTTQIEQTKPIVSIEDAIQHNSYLKEPLVVQTGNSSNMLKKSVNKLKGSLNIGGQEHYYLESQAALAIPGEDSSITVHSSTQNPTEVQHLVAHVLETSQNFVNVMVRRMGGGFGGKETQAAQLACLCAFFAKKHNIAVKGRLSRKDDMLLTGKRHDFIVKYEVGYDNNGIITALEADYFARCGYSLDLSSAIVSRALFHTDNSYYIANATFRGFLCKTNTVSNTAFRGFGGPQGLVAIENIIENIANALNVDPLLVRKNNFYKKNTNNITPYGQTITDNIINELVDELELSSDYQKRRKQIEIFNHSNKYLQKGIALSPVKFGISFTTTFLNQAGALVNIYKDGSIYINHGGTEMGQGLFIKMAQIVANEFGVDISTISVSATDTMKVPNTSSTAASSGADLNGMALLSACTRIKANLNDFAIKHFSLSHNDGLVFDAGKVIVADKNINFDEFIALAYFNRTELFSNGYYKTPKVYYDEKTAKGRPFLYYAYGGAVSEVIVDLLTGEHKVTAIDILHDVGSSLNPAIDIGQIVGGFVQGMGWLTFEELKFDPDGKLLTFGASTYKIPTSSDIPQNFKVQIMPKVSNKEGTIYKSKAVGEPPLMLAISVWLAIKNAISSAGGDAKNLSVPASFEQVFNALPRHITK